MAWLSFIELDKTVVHVIRLELVFCNCGFSLWFAFHAKMGPLKDRNSMDLTEAEYIKNRWQEYIEDLYKKILMTQITMMV